jgi:hypothetical protein
MDNEDSFLKDKVVSTWSCAFMAWCLIGQKYNYIAAHLGKANFSAMGGLTDLRGDCCKMLRR